MSGNFDLSFADEDDFLEDDEDYDNREVYNRSFSPPSPSVLKSLESFKGGTGEDANNGKKIKANPFVDDEESDDDNTSDNPNQYLQRIESYQDQEIDSQSISHVQNLVIKYFMVSNKSMSI